MLRITRTAGPALALAGEIDEDTHASLASVLAVFAESTAEVRLDLGGVSYCDLAGLRAMVRLTDTGRRVVLRNLSPGLRAVLGVVGWDDVPGLVIEAPAAEGGR